MEIGTARRISTVLLLSLLAFVPGLIPAHAAADFSLSANPSNLGRIFAGSTHKVTVTVTSTGGFSGTVNLTAFPPTGVTATLNPTSVTVSSGGSATSTLTITFGDCPFGNPPVTVEGLSGSLRHDVFVTWGIVVC